MSNLESLDEFAANNPGAKSGKPCTACQLPAEIRFTLAAAKGRHTATTILAWLLELGHTEMTRSKVERHMREHVK